MRTPLTAIPVVAGFAASAALLALAACGGGGDTAPDGGEGPATTLAELILPPQRAGWAGLPPVIQFGDELRIGATPPPARSALAALAPVAAHGQATVSHGTVQDGVGAATLIDYLQRDAAAALAGVLIRFGEAPTVRYVEGTSAGQVDELVGAVRLINANLPRDFQLTVDSSPVTAAADAAGTSPSTLAAGQILVEYDRREDWEIPYDAADNPVGAALWWDQGGAAFTARVYVDDTRVTAGARRKTVLAHELIHALGRFHPDRARFPDSIMNIPAVAADAYVLYPLDREALLAVYGTLSPGATPGEIATDLGPWDDESMHVRGDLGDLAFGTSLRNGLVQPWAAVPRPGIDLADNDALTGSATWAGRLLGLTPTADSVAGAGGMTIDLASLRGTLDFTEMESWAGAPGLVGTGATWLDGDLNYTVSVRGNLFGRTGGDEGRITGVFSGASHEGMAGTLSRDDLAAGFAGTR